MESNHRGATDIKSKPANTSRFAGQAQAMFNEGLALHQIGQLPQARASYEQALKIQPKYFDALFMLAVMVHQSEDPQKAAKLFCEALEIDPNSADAYNNLGNALSELKQYPAAIENYGRAIALKPDYAEAYGNRGAALNELEQYQAAIDSYDKAIALKPDYAQAHGNRGTALNGLGEHWDAIASYDNAIAIEPDFTEAHSNRGNALNDLKQHQAALCSCDKAIALKPDYAQAHGNRGNALYGMNQYRAAIDSYDKAIALKPDSAQAHSNRGNVLNDLKQHHAAIASYDKAIALKPDYPDAYYNRGIALSGLKRHQDAIHSYDKVLAIEPKYEYLPGTRLHVKMHLCDWRDGRSEVAGLLEKIRRDEKITPSFPVLALTASAFLQRKAAKVWVNDKHPVNHALGGIPKRIKGKKIRLGYFSANFNNHPVALLTAELFETHCRSAFEVYAFSFGQNPRDEVRLRLEEVFDTFIDVKDRSDEEVAKLSREIGIDIAIDLGGLTADSRTDVFALRAAPIQVNYIGYPGTMGAPYIDYIIADRQVIPEETRTQYAEKVVYLPCFQVNDSQRKISEKVYARQELGLPDTGFVFCCFNSNYKITPDTFNGLVRILQQVSGSVLFLYADNETAVTNLRQEARQRGLDPSRLVFGERMPTPEYLARYRSADLFLDTYPFNGGATVSDALWAGLPVLTCTGEAFASRMASSLLKAIGLPELVTATQEDYEALAIELATDPDRLKTMKDKLERHRLTAPLFDTKLFTRHIEAAFTQMVERYHADLSPEHIAVTNLLEPLMKTFLHVGCGPKQKDQTTGGFDSSEWTELRLDIDPSVQPDIIGTMTDMSAVPSESVDAVFSSHNIEHLYPHEVPLALAEFKRVLKPDGFVVITCPDLQSVCALIADDKLTEPAYTSPAGPIAPLDILYGHRPPMARGNVYMAHRCGFTQKVLTGTLQASGFTAVAARRREHPFYDLHALATKAPTSEAALRELAGVHFP